jgi:hypothetical protein
MFSAAATATSAIMAFLTGATTATTISFLGLNIAILPFTAIILGIIAVIVLVIVAWKNWDKIVNVFNKSVTFLKEKFIEAFEKIRSIFTQTPCV